MILRFIKNERRMQRLALLLSTLALTACTHSVDNRGYDFEISDISKVRLGQTKEEVLSVLGSPSTLSTFKDNAWYYISRKTATKSFFNPETIDQKIVVIHFNHDTVSSMETVDKNQAIKIDPSKNKTETTGYESGILREVFGNFGKFGAGKAPTKS